MKIAPSCTRRCEKAQAMRMIGTNSKCADEGGGRRTGDEEGEEKFRRAERLEIIKKKLRKSENPFELQSLAVASTGTALALAPTEAGTDASYRQVTKPSEWKYLRES
jgi:hypothetical protein